MPADRVVGGSPDGGAEGPIPNGSPAATRPLLVTFAAGSAGEWRIDRADSVVGESLPAASRLAMMEDAPHPLAPEVCWTVRGVVGHGRYVTRSETDALARVQRGLGQPDATRAALIPIRKNARWWALAQDERRAIFEERSQHIGLSMPYLPAITRRLHHARDLGEGFDFLTWFEYAPAEAGRFEDLVAKLRATEEWRYVEREVDIRLSWA